jgi:hypothetical protein
LREKHNAKAIRILQNALQRFPGDDRLQVQLGRAYLYATGIASEIYASEGLIGVVKRFEYVTYNGVRVSCVDAEEEMRSVGVLET